jgi:ABC-type phosphate transport system auxiliary subunit
MQRFVWNLKYADPEGFPRSYPISAIYRNTPPEPDGPFVLPGLFTVKLTVDGKSFSQPLTVKMDPRVSAPASVIDQQHTLSMQCYSGITRSYEMIGQIRKLRSQIKTARDKAGQSAISQDLEKLDKNLASLEGAAAGRFGAPAGGEMNLSRLRREMLSVMDILQGAEMQPTSQAVAAVAELQKSLATLQTRWNEISTVEVKSLNEKLKAAGLPLIG